MKKKRILFISPSLAQGGAERQIVNVAIKLKKRGYKSEFLCYGCGDFYEDLLRSADIPVKWIKHNHFLRLITCTWFIHRGKYHVLVSFLPTPSFISCFAAMISKRWKVITGERSSIIKKPKSATAKFAIWLQRYSDAIVCNSNNAKNMWEALFPQYEAKMATIYNTIEERVITSEYIPKRKGKLHICVAATVYAAKNPVGLINALLLMNEQEREKIEIDWYGKEEAETGKRDVYDETCRLIVEYKLEEYIHLHPATKDIGNRMMEADCVALFSEYEGLPNAICEGMTLAKPIIMTRVSDYRELVEDGKNGFLCDWDKPETIKNAIFKMVDASVDALKSMGELSAKKAKYLFSEDIVINQWQELIEK